MEFTRLAQLTGEDKYYDAVARITDLFDEFQNNTRLPGMWPTYLDASGCKMIEWTPEINKPLQKPLPGKDLDQELPAVADGPVVKQPEETAAATVTEELSPGGHKYVPLEKPEPFVLVPNGPNPTFKPPPPEEPLPMWLGDPGKGKIKGWDADSGLAKRQLDSDDANASPVEDSPTPIATETDAAAEPTETRPTCQEQGFASSSDYGSEEFTLGGMSDSTYEYLPKEYLLLGGLVEKYRDMYEKSMDVVKKHLLFRPMVPDENDILFSGKLMVPSLSAPSEKIGDLEAENAHLTCFAGGMFGMGAKLFDRPEDLDIAKKLTEGCIWSYNMTATGIMPEAFDAVACDSREHCSWNQTKYWETLDPRADARLEQYKDAMKTYKEQMSSASAWYEEELRAMATPPPTLEETAVGAVEARPTPTVVADLLDKRQLADLEDDVLEQQVTPLKESPAPEVSQDRESVMGGEAEEGEGPPTPVQSVAESPSPSRTLPAFPVIYTPKVPPTHEEYIKNRIQEERLPPGVTFIKARGYILR